MCAPLKACSDRSTTKEGAVQLTTQVHDMWNEVQKIRPWNLESRSTNHQITL